MYVTAPLTFSLGGAPGDEENKPIARVLPAEQEVVVGAVVKLDGRSSTDPHDASLQYFWSFVQVPIGSQVPTFGFTQLEADASIVSFAPDITGTYKVRLLVFNGTTLSDPDESLIDVRVILVPHHQGFVPDASFIWNYLSDFWTQVPDRKKFETVWSSAIQTVASEMLKLYQYQYNKSIRDIQETAQRRWLSFSPVLELERSSLSFVLADDTAGSAAYTYSLDPVTGLQEIDQPSYSNGVTITSSEGDFTTTAYGSTPFFGKVLQLAGRSYTTTRANGVFQSLTYGIDGITSGSVTFTGTGFSSEMVGATLRILGPSWSALLGDYTIATYIDPTQITVSAIHPGTTWSGTTGLEYTVLPATPKSSSIFADRLQIPAGLLNQYWRLSSTLISSETDFEAQGVSPGDLIQVEVTRSDLSLISNFYIQVVSVDRNRLGFVLNLDDLVDGVASAALSKDIQITLATDLIVSGLGADINGNLTYALDAATIKKTVTSPIFKRKYFEKELTFEDDISVGPFSIRIRPVQIIRNTKISISDDFVSIPILQEYVKQPLISEEDGVLYRITPEGRTTIPRRPYLLSENLDYILDDESSIFGICNTVDGNSEITIPNGDLIDRSIKAGDTIDIDIGITTTKFDIRKVLTADTIQVYPAPSVTETGARFVINRRIPGKFLRFIGGVFSKTAPAPQRLWSEVSYLDNGEAIENNFGAMVGLRRADLEKVGSGIPYKSAVAGLMYALVNGPTINNLNLSAQILMGLPFAQNAGVIREINPAFRKREDGAPLYGRILIDALDSKGNRLGITNIYFYPEGRQEYTGGNWVTVLPKFSGIGINPDTGIEYAVGDLVTQFAPLSKGVEIQEYLITPDWLGVLEAQGNVGTSLRKYHSFQLVLNSDLISATDIDIVADFMTKVRAHHVRLTSSILQTLEDDVTSTDYFFFNRSIDLFDSSDLGTPAALMVDDLDENASYTSVDGVMYTRLHVGYDLVTTKDSDTVTSAAGGLVNPRANESWDGTLVRVGDIVRIESGSNVGIWPVKAINSDSSLNVDRGTSNFESATGQQYTVFRPLKNPIFVGKCGVVQTSSSVSMLETNGSPAGIGAAGVSVGDCLVFADLSVINSTVSQRYSIIEVNTSATTPTIKTLPAIKETTGTYTAWVVREGLVAKGTMVPATSTSEVFYGNCTTGGDYFSFVDTASHRNSWLNLAMVRPGDRLQIGSNVHMIMRFEPSTRKALVTPPVLTTESDKQVTVTLRPDRAASVISFNLLDRLPNDYLELTLMASSTVGDKAQTTAASKDVTLTVETPSNFAVPGDLLVLLAGADSTRDVGYGVGAFPIHQLNSGGSTIHLMDALTATGSFQYSFRRRRPNEG